MRYTLFDARTRTARLNHVCIWCGELIAPGFKYVDERSLYDGHIQRHRWHPECQAAMCDFARNGEVEFNPWENPRPGKLGNELVTP